MALCVGRWSHWLKEPPGAEEGLWAVGLVNPTPSPSRPPVHRVGTSSFLSHVSQDRGWGRINKARPGCPRTCTSFADTPLAERSGGTPEPFRYFIWSVAENRLPSLVPVRSAGFVGKVTPEKPVQEMPAALVSRVYLMRCGFCARCTSFTWSSWKGPRGLLPGPAARTPQSARCCAGGTF